MVERHLAKVNVASSNLVFRSISEQVVLVPIFFMLFLKNLKKPFIILKKSAIIYNNDYCAEKYIMED